MPKALYDTPVCPTDCNNQTSIGNVNFENCVEAMGIYESEICEIVIGIPNAQGEPINGPTAFDAATFLAWYTANVGPDQAYKSIIGIGDMSSEGATTAVFSKRRTKTIGSKPFKVNMTIDDMSDENREVIRSFECGLSVVAWLITYSGNAFGGVKGIYATISNASLPLERGEGNYEKGLFEMDWSADAAPPRVVGVF